MAKPKARILVVEDDPAILNGLLDVFVFHGFEAKGEMDGGRGLDRALSGRFDLLVLDVMLPTLSGLNICRKVRAEKPEQAIIMLTAKGAEDDVVNGFNAGADDYVTKPFSLAELMVRIEAVLRRAGKNLGNESLTTGGITFDGTRLTATREGKSLPITRREMDIMLYLHRAGGRIVTKRELLSEVWQYHNPDVETRTVDIHILKLRKKISELNTDITLVHTVRGEGYRLGEE